MLGGVVFCCGGVIWWAWYIVYLFVAACSFLIIVGCLPFWSFHICKSLEHAHYLPVPKYHAHLSTLSNESSTFISSFFCHTSCLGWLLLPILLLLLLVLEGV